MTVIVSFVYSEYVVSLYGAPNITNLFASFLVLWNIFFSPLWILCLNRYMSYLITHTLIFMAFPIWAKYIFYKTLFVLTRANNLHYTHLYTTKIVFKMNQMTIIQFLLNNEMEKYGLLPFLYFATLINYKSDIPWIMQISSEYHDTL